MAGRGKAIALCAALAVAFACAAAGSASGANPTVPTTILGGHLYPGPFGDTYVYGHVELPDSQDQAGIANQTVALYASPFPFTAWTQVATLTTDFGGYFSYHTSIAQNMTYRAVWQTNPPVQSKDKLVKLPLKLSFKASHSRVKRKGLVTFKGAGRPGHPGAAVELQQANNNGYFVTVAKSVRSPGNTRTFANRNPDGPPAPPGAGELQIRRHSPSETAETSCRRPFALRNARRKRPLCARIRRNFDPLERMIDQEMTLNSSNSARTVCATGPA